MTMQFPHCDQRILHAPGECKYCDSHAEWQALRVAWGIAFTGKTPVEEDHRKELPCPADFNRGDRHRQWGGNVASREEVTSKGIQPPTLEQLAKWRPPSHKDD